MKTAVTNVIIILGIVSGLTGGTGILPDVLTAAVGGTVTFITSVSPPVTPFVAVIWKCINSDSAQETLINYNYNYYNNYIRIEYMYIDRITLFRSTGSLELRNLTLSDSGVYTVRISSNGLWITGQTRLSVFVPVSIVNISSTDLMEFNSSVSLSCSSSGSSLSFLWLNGSSEVTATDRVHLTDGGRNLTIVNVSRYDQGPFRCRVSSAVINGTSDPVKLFIRYGADNVGISGPGKLEVEQTLVLICSAESSPPADYTWTLNGKEMLNHSAVFIKHGIQCSDSGQYICQARNQLTGRTSLGEHRVSVQVCGLSPGAIAGIVIACVLVFGGVLAGGLCIFWIKSKLLYTSRSESSAQPRQAEHEEPVYENNYVGLQASSLAPKTRGHCSTSS